MLTQPSLPLNDCCCGGEVVPLSAPAPASSRNGRMWDVIAGAASLGVWLLIPKCPMCLAAHLALWTGLGLSFAAASYVRWSLMILSGALLLGVVARRAIDLRKQFALLRAGRA